MPVARLDQDKLILGNLAKRMARQEVDPLSPLIDRYFIIRNKPGTARLRSVRLPLVERPRPGGRLSPSQLLGCERAQVFKFTGFKGIKRTDPHSESIFDDGNWRHHRWQAIFKDMQAVLGRDHFKVLSIEEDIEIPDLFVAGSLDATIWIKGYGRLVVDYKGINDRGFTQILSLDKPVEKHVKQLMTYLKARGIKRGLLFYENKNDQRWVCFMVSWDEAIWSEIEDWSMRVLSAMENEKLPPRDLECQRGTYMEERCPYAGTCYGEKEHEEIRSKVYLRFTSIEEEWAKSHEPV